MKRKTFSLAGLALATLLLAVPAAAQQTAQVGQAAPDFTLTDESGNAHTLSSYQGQVVVLEWTCSTCPFVQRHYESQNMQHTAQSLAEQGVVWLAVDSTHYNTVEETQAWKAAQGFAYPTLIDQDGSVGRAYGAQTTPHMYVIDAAGVLRYQGAIDDDPRDNNESETNYVTQAVSALLAGGEPSVTSTDPYGCSVKYADEE